jgi:hypothetical protein
MHYCTFVSLISAGYACFNKFERFSLRIVSIIQKNDRSRDSSGFSQPIPPERLIYTTSTILSPSFFTDLSVSPSLPPIFRIRATVPPRASIVPAHNHRKPYVANRHVNLSVLCLTCRSPRVCLICFVCLFWALKR